MNVKRLTNTLHLLRDEEIVDFDLSDLVIEGNRVFEMGTIPRADMPQLKGYPRKGAIAAKLEKDKHGKVDVSSAFVDYMNTNCDVTAVPKTMNAAMMRGIQSELVASKVANTVPKLMRDLTHKKFHQTYIVDQDGVLLDGHHGWASVRVWSLLKNREAFLNVLMFDTSIEHLLEQAHQFTTMVGIENKEGV